jgi:transglycosylase-like protein with SLT domain
VPARWIRAFIQIESGGDEHAISPRGAMGLMRLIPDTWVELGVRYGLGLDPFDPRDNLFAGTAYLREMHERFGSAGFLTAYHAGPSRYEHHLATGQPLPSPMSPQSHHCSATNRDSAPHLAAGVQFLGGSLRCSSVASTHAADYRRASGMLQYRNSLLSSRLAFHAKTVAAELSLHPLNEDQPK